MFELLAGLPSTTSCTKRPNATFSMEKVVGGWGSGQAVMNGVRDCQATTLEAEARQQSVRLDDAAQGRVTLFASTAMAAANPSA